MDDMIKHLDNLEKIIAIAVQGLEDIALYTEGESRRRSLTTISDMKALMEKNKIIV